MKSAIESLMNERGRLRTAHEMLNAALAEEVRDEAFVPFYIAVADYMEASMGRLHDQDVKMLQRLAEALEPADAEEEEIIAEVYRRLDGNQAHLKDFLACRADLQSAGASAVGKFEESSRAYIDFIHNRMGHHAPSTDLARKIFGEDDWADIANIDQGYFSKEQALYESVLQTRPGSVPLGQEASEYVVQYRRDKG
ncbi:MAG: hypothetical protein OER85_02380 [Gammaproteobacteria bacterium]|nr:hypothetical protein [Gammaproteobacteria bacterium]